MSTMHGAGAPYAARLTVDYPKKLDRLTTLFRLIWVLPIAVILSVVVAAGDGARTGGMLLGGLWLATMLMLAFRMLYPRWWFDFARELTRFGARVGAYLALLTDRYPSTVDEQSVHVEIDYPDVERDLNRWLPLVKWLLAVPYYIVLTALWIGVVVAIVVAWFAILATGRYPQALFDYVVGVGRWNLRVSACLPARHRPLSAVQPEAVRNHPMTDTRPAGPMSTMTGKTVLITGGTGGIGRAAAIGLAAMGARVGITGRDRARAEAAAAAITRDSGNPAVDVFVADLSSQAEVRRLAGEVLAAYPRLDVLLNNVGGFWAHRHATADGLEHTFALNHLAPFLLTSLLVERLTASAPARVVTVSSGAQSMGEIDFDNLMGERKYSGQDAYNQSKLANVMFTYELARRLEGTGVTATALHPGMTSTAFRHGGHRARVGADHRSPPTVHEEP